ncbi:MAG: hypothetical protein R6V85_07265 [Polyangia bacterium]
MECGEVAGCLCSLQRTEGEPLAGDVGDYWREFPAGTFRPPIIEPYRPKHRYWSGYV